MNLEHIVNIAYLGLKKGLYRLFRIKKSDIEKSMRQFFFSFARRAESHNALSDAKKSDMGPENACNWIVF